jgi:hypothetical protein
MDSALFLNISEKDIFYFSIRNEKLPAEPFIHSKAVDMVVGSI